MTEQAWSIQELVQRHRWLLDYLLKQFPVGSINVFDRDFCYLYATGAGHDRLGVLPVALIGKRLSDIFPVDVVTQAEPFLCRAFAGETVAFTMVAYGQGYDVRAWPLAEADGSIGAIVAVAQEIAVPPQAGAELTPRQLQIVALVAAGLSNKEIARRLTIATSTVRNQVTDILNRLDLASRTQLAVWAIRRGLDRGDRATQAGDEPRKFT